MIRRILLISGLIFLALLSTGNPITPAKAQDAFTAPERAAIEQMIRDYIIKNPGIILESVQRLSAREKAADQRQQRQTLVDMREALENDSGSHVGGNPKGDVTLVEFFDYRCTYCKRFFPVLADIIKEDPNVRVVFKEFPILGADSVIASRAALAARSQNKDLYLPLHNALMETRGVFSERRILDIAAEVGLDVERLKRDMSAPEIERVISRNYQQAEALGIQGTPGFVIGDQVIRGYVNGKQMQALIQDARKNCTTC